MSLKLSANTKSEILFWQYKNSLQAAFSGGNIKGKKAIRENFWID